MGSVYPVADNTVKKRRQKGCYTDTVIYPGRYDPGKHTVVLSDQICTCGGLWYIHAVSDAFGRIRINYLQYFYLLCIIHKGYKSLTILNDSLLNSI